jgi:hypothetical protein
MAGTEGDLVSGKELGRWLGLTGKAVKRRMTVGQGSAQWCRQSKRQGKMVSWERRSTVDCGYTLDHSFGQQFDERKV